MKPTPGQTYASPKNPEILFFIEAVHTDERDGFFTVEMCHPSDIDIMNAPTYELTCDEWTALAAEYALALST